MARCRSCGLDVVGANADKVEAIRLARYRALQEAADYLQGRGLIIESEAVRLLWGDQPVPAGLNRPRG